MSPLVLATAQGAPVLQPAPTAALAIRGLTVAYGDRPVVFSADGTFPAGSMTAIIGPNGAGKSSLLKAALGLIPAVSGEVTVAGRPLAAMRQKLAYVPQRASVDWDFPARVRDVVAMGLYPALGLFRPFGPTQRTAVAQALDRVGMGGFAARQIGELSGGQQQRVFLARALAQGAEIYLLDEPFAGVDAATEAAIVGVLQALRDAGQTVVAVHHDLSTVPAYFDRALVMNGRVLAEGPVATTMTEAVLTRAYGGRVPH